MPRVRELSFEEMPEALAPTIKSVFGGETGKGTMTGTPGNWWTVWARVPGILSAFSAYPQQNAPLDAKLREIALIRTGYVRQSRFVFSQHCKAARRMGVEDAKVEAVPYWTLSDVFGDAERACLAYVDALMLEDGRVHDKVFEALKQHLGEEAILALTYVVNMYSLHAVSTRALRLEYDDIDERIREIPVPTERRVQDWKG